MALRCFVWVDLGALPPNPRLFPLLVNSHDNTRESDYTGPTLMLVGT